MSSAPQVSVAIISYQQRAYIGEALQSVVDQDYPNLQIVVSDDHSTDGTAEEIAKFAERYSDRIIALLNGDRVGMTRNSNRALSRCTGQYIALLGGDDVFLPGKVSRQVEWFEQGSDRVLCGHQVEVFYEDGSPSHPFQRQLRTGCGAADIIRHGSFAACSTMVRADKIPAHGFDEEVHLVSDFMLWVEVLADGGEFGYVPGTYARYRRHGTNVSANVPINVQDAARAIELIEQRYPQYSVDCRRARARLIDYPLGKHHLARGDKHAARAAFVDAINRQPWAAWAWAGLMKSLVPV
jgi:glycosyltransferase involved in cell wall biosynthesis